LRVAAAPLYAARVRLEDLRRTPVPDLHRLYVEEARPAQRGLSALKEDPRAGARRVAEKIEKRNHEAQAEGRRLSRLCAFELPLWEQGIVLVGGCDEVGMAPLAGPVIAAAVILRAGTRSRASTTPSCSRRKSATRWSRRSRAGGRRSGSDGRR